MIRNLIGRLGDQPGLGMETGMQYNLADTGIFGYALMAGPTFGDAIDVACRYAALTEAKELCIAERALHRRLAAEGASYRGLLDELRATLACELLKSGLTVAETAHRLGYSETAAFTRAHVRWNGHPPSRRNVRE